MHSPEGNPYAPPLPPQVDDAEVVRQRFRWRVIPVAFLGVMAFIAFVGSAGMTCYFWGMTFFVGDPPPLADPRVYKPLILFPLRTMLSTLLIASTVSIWRGSFLRGFLWLIAALALSSLLNHALPLNG